MRLSQHFTLAEFERSMVATRLGIDNTMPPELIVRAANLCSSVLEVVRGHYGQPVIVHSGYRCPELNKAIGGSPKSQHMRGEAADFHVHGHDNLKVAEWMADNLDFDQLIMEGTWIHVSYREGANRNEVLTAHFENGRAHYTRGLQGTA